MLLKNTLYSSLLLFSSLFITPLTAQSYNIELGFSIGNVLESEHSLGKAEIHASLLKKLGFGELGLDLATGGNFIPGERSEQTMDSEILSPNDSQFFSAGLIYRIPLTSLIFIEPRLAYTSLSTFVRTEDQEKISTANFSLGVGLGMTFDKVSGSLRYQYMGSTIASEGIRDNIRIITVEQDISMILLRISYRFSL